MCKNEKGKGNDDGRVRQKKDFEDAREQEVQQIYRERKRKRKREKEREREGIPRETSFC